ncbi:enoyl-CoA hydratase/isomerase family protein [Cladophialophora carrionii]|uniref:Enoyl-CoA hydratase/isomerase family protein n=1 Tax=Cladophialophora carrionii TaxID=86049 RepID=A0A1C1CPH5_9EURO|nr:enoyl-CoA hydratase/isomerase family protein [Cladophialophora carrionii]
MPPIPPLFVLPVPPTLSASSSAPGGQGSFICTQAAHQVYLLSFSCPPDNRLVPAFNQTFLLALDIIEHRLPRGVVITTSSISKFYSNGLDFENAIKDPTFFPNSLYPLWRRLITYPMPTIALMNGHAFAGGLMTAMMHDYRIMNPHKGFLCLNELDFGAALQPAMASVFRVKLSMTTFRNMVLESKRFPALEALKEGIIDGVGGVDETLKFIAEMKLTQKAQGRSYGQIKEELYREVVKDLDEAAETRGKLAARDLDRSRRDLEARKRVDDYQAVVQRAKL